MGYDDLRDRRKVGKSHWFLYTIVLLSVGGGIYYAWSQDFDLGKIKKTFTGEGASVRLFGVAEKAPKTVQNWKEKTEVFITEGLDLITEKPKEIVGNIVKDVAKTALESTKKEAAQVLGLEAGTGASVPSGISIVRPMKQSLLLRIEAEEEDVSYTIDWGDGQVSKGNVLKKESKTADHAWVKPGEYTVKAGIEGKGGGVKIFSFPVTIVK